MGKVTSTLYRDFLNELKTTIQFSQASDKSQNFCIIKLVNPVVRLYLSSSLSNQQKILFKNKTTTGFI